jgi:hypothetical protein
MTGDPTGRFVTTTAIRQAVDGHETEILGKLGIEWHGKGHIHCPYPDHPDKDPSWRWDERKKRAFCTCMVGPKSHSIFDVAAKILGLDFDAVKLRIAELLGRSDLIIEKRNGHAQKLDAKSLLHPVAGNRDDDLVFRYLGNRLGIDPDQVPRPATPVTGLKALGYFDPPARRNGNRRFVGSYPCAVFGTVAADGREHAHRIYLSSDGANKAQLGETADGKPRDAKKSAHTEEGQISTAGCGVVWGDVERAAHCIVTEGIETGCAVAHALREEVESRAILVVSAITAGGVEAFMPWPATKRITVDADRDELKTGDGHRRGERAARTLGFRHYQQFEVGIALPGVAGETIDWLDIARRDGLDSVRSSILSAPLFEPTEEELAQSKEQASRSNRLAQIKTIYPLPSVMSGEFDYWYTPNGEIWVHKLVKEEDKETSEVKKVWMPIASPFGVPAWLQRSDAEDAHGLRVLIEGMDGQQRPTDIERAELALRGGSEIRSRLMQAGLRASLSGQAEILTLLQLAKPSESIIIVSRPGWCSTLDDGWGFITPGGDFLGTNSGRRIELDSAVRLAARISRGGTLQGWQEAVRVAITSPNCPHWILGIVSGLAGPIVQLCQLPSCGLAPTGPTSVGKSIAQQLAASSWSASRLTDGGLFKSWRSTENAIEVLARDATGTVLPLDEMGHVDGRVVGRVIYSVAGGVAKRRMDKPGRLLATETWSTFLLLSSELSLREKVVGDGGQWTGGMAARVLDVDVASVNPAVATEKLALISGIHAHYGHAGPLFVEGLIRHEMHHQPERLRQRITSIASELAGKQSNSAQVRAAEPLAIIYVTGLFAIQFGLLPLAEDALREAVQWAWHHFRESPDASVLDPATQIVPNIQRWVAERWDVTCKPVGTGDPSVRSAVAQPGLNNREAVAWYDDTTIYIPSGRLVEAAGVLLSETAIARHLDRSGLLARRASDQRIAVRYVPNIGKLDAYALRRAEFHSGRDADPLQEVVDGG